MTPLYTSVRYGSIEHIKGSELNNLVIPLHTCVDTLWVPVEHNAVYSVLNNLVIPLHTSVQYGSLEKLKESVVYLTAQTQIY